jgi:bacillithiol biosynthesis cysteine-adding enzyme BshC
MRIVPTPLGFPVPALEPRTGGLDGSLLDAVVRAPGTAPLLERLADPDVLVVTTGQQPGLFTGPLYTVYKALSAASLARRLEAEWGRPVQPLFWLAGDDHDFEEARSAGILDAGGTVVTLALPDRPADAPQVPMSRLPLGPEVAGLLSHLGEALPESPFRPATMEWLRRSYRPGATVGEAFGSALAELLAPLGIACLDASHSSVKAAMAPLLVQSLALAGELDGLLASHAHALEQQGAPVTVPVGQGASLVFVEGPQGRDRLVIDAGGFGLRRSGTRYSMGDLETMAEREAERLSPNVLLRPVLESALLPTVGYVAGPGELRYLAMCQPLYARLGVYRQPPVPRWSGIVVEPRVDRVLRKFGASLEELLQPGTALESRVIRSQMPEALLRASDRLRDAVGAEYQVILDAAVGVDPTLERPVASAWHHALTELGTVEKKVQGHLKKREATELAQIARAREAVLPGGKPQERVLTVSSWLARFGPSFLTDVAGQVDAWYGSALAGDGPPS